ncbi:MAG TPA: GNAT family N-acetyltransferase [Syntrophales bacterium]|nr:GNAT family N-acetyltransferase [Syntrophales bacterium]
MAHRTGKKPAGIVPVSTDEAIGAVEALAREIWTEHYTPIIGKAQVDYMLEHFQSREAIAGQIREGYAYFLLEEGGERVGYLSIQPRQNELFLSKIYVKVSERGKGHARAAVHFVEGFARERHLTRITLTVNKNNSGSIRAYERLGFEKVEDLVQDIGGGFVMDDYRMEKSLKGGKETMKADIPKLIETLAKNNIPAFYVRDAREAFAKVMAMIPEGSSVGLGDSLTLEQIGVIDALEKGNYAFFNSWRDGLSQEERMELKRRSLVSDVFVTGTNALTLDGKIVNVDALGNRTAAMLFGPRKVIVVVGVNKIVANLEEALKRIRTIAAPQNVKQKTHFHPTPPCGITGECGDCSGPWRICNKTVIIERQLDNERYKPLITVVIVGEQLGL